MTNIVPEACPLCENVQAWAVATGEEIVLYDGHWLALDIHRDLEALRFTGGRK